jgi:hypothetical protein
MTSLFWEDLTADLKDPQFLRSCVRESVRIAITDATINAAIQA